MTEQAKRGSLQENPIVWIMYRISFPLARLFNRLGISANAVSAMSVISALVAAIYLVSAHNLLVFALAWVLSIVLDFCDGMVARLSGTSNKSAFKLDHFLDLVKFSLITLALGIFWNSNGVTLTLLIATQSIFTFLVLNNGAAKSSDEHFDKAQGEKKGWRSNSLLNTTVVTAGTFHAGQLLLLAFAPLAPWVTILVYLYIFLIGIVMTIRAIRILRLQPKTF